MDYILGFDASEFQEDIDFNQVKAAGYRFGITRMTYAYPGQPIKTDPFASKNYDGMVAAGILPGGYHKVGWTDPVAEADAFIAAMSPFAENDLYAHDMEPARDVPIPANWSEWEQAYVQRIYDRTGVWSIRYENISMSNTMPKQGVVTNCPSWVAAPSFDWEAAVPVNVPVIIQQGPAIAIPGIPANVTDTDAFFGQGTPDELLAELKKLGYHAPAVTPSVVPVPPVPPVPPVTPVEPPQPPPAPNPEPGTVVEPETPPAPPTNGTAIDVVITPPKPKPVSAVEPKPSELIKAEGFIVKLGRYNKFFVGLVGAVLTYLSLHYGSSTIVQDAVLIASVLGIYAIPNTPSGPAK